MDVDLTSKYRQYVKSSSQPKNEVELIKVKQMCQSEVASLSILVDVFHKHCSQTMREIEALVTQLRERLN